ncbi:MAG: pantoate--beta-alanine ligase, partial [Flavobacteriales bacterium]|nr:pantoate--beta-alanine ligase [Flavobacteriales bacterium]
MIVIKLASEMLNLANNLASEGTTVGFVPTMGALHDGHVSLIRKAKEENQTVVVSVFVNPTQFNDPNDLEKYPRTFEKDERILASENVDVMFYPSANEIYPDKKQAVFELDGLDTCMEGPNRPGHFNGIVQVVTRLFDLTSPTKAYFGEK